MSLIMVVDTIADFLVSNIYRKKFLSIDYGTKFIGTAISDQSNIISIPYKTLDKKESSISFVMFSLNILHGKSSFLKIRCFT